MSFTTEIKDEISSIECSKTEMMAELSGYIRNCHEKPKKEIVLTTENKCLVDRIINFIDEIYQIKSQVTIINNVNFSKKDLYQIVINQKVSEIYFDLGIKDEKGNNLDNPPNYLIEGNSELKSYLRGVFLQTGSISDPKKSGYHLEFLIVDAKEAVFVQKLLNNFDFNAKILNRENGFMIYIKEADKISDFLKIIGANKAVLYYENVRVYRDRKNNTNRLNNMEQANTDKIIETANSQLEDIEIIEANDGLVLLDDKVLVALNYRKKYPEASLKELAEIISLETNKSITKSGLNHRLKKIEDLAKQFRKMQSDNK